MNVGLMAVCNFGCRVSGFGFSVGERMFMGGSRGPHLASTHNIPVNKRHSTLSLLAPYCGIDWSYRDRLTVSFVVAQPDSLTRSRLSS
jgi:hypothetical protein